MHINISHDLKYPLELKTAMILRPYKETIFYNSNYGLRHPLAIYNISIDAVIENLGNLLSCLEQFQNERLARELSDNKLNRDLIVSTDQYLDSMMEHLDDCFSIIRTMFHDGEDKKYKKACQNFKEAIKGFRDHIAKQVNKIKHSQARIRLITFYNDTISLPGYYIEGVLEDGKVGPHPDIHPKSNTAFSYNREVRYSICGLLFVSEILLNNIKQALPDRVGKVQKSDNHKFGNIVDKVSRLPFMFFPDEYKKPVPLILKTSNQRIIRYPSLISRPKKLPTPLRIKTEFQVDGVSKAYVLPYFGKDI
jgi:hypothetical protein